MTSCKQLLVAKFFMTINGLWAFGREGFSLKIYNIYFYISFVFYILFNLSQAWQAVRIMGEDVVNTAINLGVTVAYFVHIYKVLICKGKKIRNLVSAIQEKETKILSSSDEAKKAIFEKFAKRGNQAALFYILWGTTGISTYWVNPLIKDHLIPPHYNNETMLYERSFIFSSWFPFNEFKYYKTAYFLQFLGGFYGYSYISYIGAFLYSTLKFCVGQLKILQITFKNFKEYTSQYIIQNNVSEEEAERMVLKSCIEEHQSIINFVRILNDALRTYLLLDFIISSFHMSLLLFQLLQTTFLPDLIKVYMFFGNMSIHFYLFYSTAQDIIFESTQISDAIFGCGWDTLKNEKVKKDLIMVMRRAQRPLFVNIGPIYIASLEALVGIYKAMYSYVVLIMQMGNN